MNTLLVFTLAFVAVCMADVSHIVGQQHQHQQQPSAAILKQTQDSEPNGAFGYEFESEDGTAVKAEGSPTGEIRGAYHYVDPEGKPVDVVWSAGPNGFVAEGPSIHPVPKSVVDTLAYNAAHPEEASVRP